MLLASQHRAEQIPEAIADDRETIEPDDKVILFVEDDPNYARILVDLAHKLNFKVLVAMRGAEALPLATQYRPTAISLDVALPDMLGWTVLNQLKLEPSTRHIPVQMVTLDEDHQHGLSRGAFGFVVKPATTDLIEDAYRKLMRFAEPHDKKLLVIEDNKAEQLSIRELLDGEGVEIKGVTTGKEALKAMQKEAFDCAVLDLRLPDMSGFEILEKMQTDPKLVSLPVIVYTGKELTSEEEARLQTMARKVVVKGVESPERLLDET